MQTTSDTTSANEQLIDRLTRRATQLAALLSTTFSIEFQAYSSDIQSNYLWACSDIANEVSDITQKLEVEIGRANHA